MSRQPGSPIVLKDVPNTTGILIYRVPLKEEAFGHIDLWKTTIAGTIAMRLLLFLHLKLPCGG
jgi:hypothetical protein